MLPPWAAESNFIFTAALFVFALWESNLRCGLLPCNSQHEALFSHSPVKMDVLDASGNVVAWTEGGKRITTHDGDILDIADDTDAPQPDFPALPVETVLRYDGARFDRFNRNRRADPEYGAGASSVVETRLTLRNAGKVPLPPGPFRVLRGDPSVPLEWVGTDWLPALAPGESVTLRLGPAAGLSGRRERKAFTETEPLKAAEESFEIAVANQTPFDRTVEVLEHLYRGDRWEIAASSAPYEPGPVPDSIVFRLPVKAGAERTVTYTVRYAW